MIIRQDLRVIKKSSWSHAEVGEGGVTGAPEVEKMKSAEEAKSQSG